MEVPELGTDSLSLRDTPSLFSQNNLGLSVMQVLNFHDWKNLS